MVVPVIRMGRYRRPERLRTAVSRASGAHGLNGRCAPGLASQPFSLAHGTDLDPSSRCVWRPPPEMVLQDKQELRRKLRQVRKAHVAGLPGATRGLIFMRPPGALAAAVPERACVGLYHAVGAEAPARGLAKWFAENGRRIALPWFGATDEAMAFRAWTDPWDDSDLVTGPYGALQPKGEAAEVVPDVVIAPLLGFTAEGHRLGQGGGHYDRWLAAHPAALAIGLGWDVQLVDQIPFEPHDRVLAAVLTPTRIYGELK